MLESRAVIVIPIYKSEISEFELKSLRQAIKIFKNRNMVFAYPKSLNLSSYKNVLDEYTDDIKSRISFEEFKDKLFKGIYGYNDLCLSKCFYERFENYEYMLIYQLDAYVFEDKLDYYIDGGIDYIGAPCFYGFRGAVEPNYSGHLNGGLSLRNISKFKKICIKTDKLSSFIILYKNRLYGKRYFVKFILYKLKLQKHKPYNWEDMFFSYAAPLLLSDYKIASYEEAKSFAFDCLAEVLYKENGCKLPMGCHAFYREKSWEFWKEFIK